MPVDARDFMSNSPRTSGFAGAIRPFRRVASRLPVIGPLLRWVKQSFNRSRSFRISLGKLRLRPMTESEQILELRRQVDELHAKLRAHQPLFADYQVVCRRIVELEDQLLQDEKASVEA